MGGPANYWCKVISKKIIIKEMEYRVSKSVTFVSQNNVAVKEQQVNGSFDGKNILCIRYTLMGFERNNQVRFFYKQINKLIKCSSTIDPWWFSGFIDGEGSFILSITENNKLKLGWNVQLFFQLTLHEKDKYILDQIKNFFAGDGKIYRSGSNLLQYRVFTKKDLQVIISHVDRFPLITNKQADYVLWKSAYRIFQNKEHLTIEGLHKIVAIKASMNLGLSEKLKTAFSSVIPVVRPLIKNDEIPSPHWLAGFTSAEGSYMIKIYESQNQSLGFCIYLDFQITQHSRDEQLMITFIKYFDCGRVYKNRNTFEFHVSKLSDLNEKIIPFFTNYPILGVKSKDFEDFCKVAELMNNKKHLTEEGLEQIKKIKAGMNTGRKWH